MYHVVNNKCSPFSAAYVKDCDGGNELKRSQVVPAVDVHLTSEEVRVMMAYKLYFERIGSDMHVLIAIIN